MMTIMMKTMTTTMMMIMIMIMIIMVVTNNGNRTEWSPIRCVIIRVKRESNLLITSMITDRHGTKFHYQLIISITISRIASVQLMVSLQSRRISEHALESRPPFLVWEPRKPGMSTTEWPRVWEWASFFARPNLFNSDEPKWRLRQWMNLFVTQQNG